MAVEVFVGPQLSDLEGPAGEGPIGASLVCRSLLGLLYSLEVSDLSD